MKTLLTTVVVLFLLLASSPLSAQEVTRIPIVFWPLEQEERSVTRRTLLRPMTRTRFIIALTACLLCAGCASFVVELEGPPSVSESRPPRACEGDEPVLLGLAFSGGGSRAAMFAAGGLEALAVTAAEDRDCSLLERASYVSTVSGGSIAAAYFAAHKPDGSVPTLSDNGKLHADYRRFFDDLRASMRMNLAKKTEWQQAKQFRWLNPSKRAKSLGEILDREFLDGMTMESVGDREQRGDLPTMLINSTWYHSGRRFVISSLPATAFDYPYGDDRLEATTAEDLGVDLDRMRLSTAVAASASLPWLIGPVTFVVRDADGEPSYWHAGDGGLTDNQGIESLMEAIFSGLDHGDGPARRAVIVAFDGSQPFEVAEEQLLSKRNKQFVNPTHVLTIMEERARAHHELSLADRYSDRLDVVFLRHHEAKLAVADLPPSCRDDKFALGDPAQIREYLMRIPTRLKLRSECDGDLMHLAALRLVEEHRPRIVELLGR